MQDIPEERYAPYLDVKSGGGGSTMNIYNRGYANRSRYHPMWKPSWTATGKDFYSLKTDDLASLVLSSWPH